MTPDCANSGQGSDSISVVIPTYGRESILVDTLHMLIDIKRSKDEIVVVDQSEFHTSEVDARMAYWNLRGDIRWIRHSPPSIPAAMNRGVREASGTIIIFLDDDVIPCAELFSAHVAAHGVHASVLVAGKVLQPWHSDDENTAVFTSDSASYETEFIGCNFSISRALLLELGGFDENFRGAAYSYEKEFGDRLLSAGHRIWYEPAASIRHLHDVSGGTRSKGGHLTSWHPRHPVGAYYYLFISPRVRWRAAKALQRLFRSMMTRHHLRRPWYIPVTLISELSGLAWALCLRLKGPALPFSRVADVRSSM